MGCRASTGGSIYSLPRGGVPPRSTESQLLSPMPLKVGTKAPNFPLKTKTADGLKDVKLSDNFGKKQTVLLFFPLAYTGVCTQEMCDITAGLGAYSSLHADVIGVTVHSPPSQEA